MARDRDPDREGPDEYEGGRRNLVPFVITLSVLLVLLLVVIALLFLRLREARGQVDTLSESLTSTQQQLDALWAQQAAATPTAAPTPDASPTPSPTPEITATPELTATPEPTASPTPVPLLRESITQEMMGDTLRPADDEWYDAAKPAFVNAAYTLNVRNGPDTTYRISMVLTNNAKAELLAERGGWVLLRVDGAYGWAAGVFLTPEGEATPAATNAPVIPAPAGTATPAATNAPAAPTAAPAVSPATGTDL